LQEENHRKDSTARGIVPEEKKREVSDFGGVFVSMDWLSTSGTIGTEVLLTATTVARKRKEKRLVSSLSSAPLDLLRRISQLRGSFPGERSYGGK